MFKKLVIATVAVVAGLFILNSTHLGSYARTAFHKVKTAVKGQIKPEFMLDTARHEAAQLVPDMRRNISAVAAKDVAVARLRDEVASIRTNLDKQKDHVRAMAAELRSGEQKTSYTLNDRTYSKRSLSDRLSHELATSQATAKTLAAKEALLESEEKALEAARDQLAGMRSIKEQIDTEIARLEAEVQTLRLAELRSNNSIEIDNSRYARIRDMLNTVHDQVQVGLKTLDYARKYDFETPAPEVKTSRNTAQLIQDAEEFAGSDTGDKSAKK